MMQKISYQSALRMVLNIPVCSTSRVVCLDDAAGKILSEPLYAKYNVPIAPVSAMDGFAVSSNETRGASQEHPKTLRNFERVNTGNVVKSDFDAVIMIEDVLFDKSEHSSEITIHSPIKKGKNVRQTGEDITSGRMILPKGARIRAFDIGALGGYGYTDIPVQTISVGIIPTGTELISVGTEPKPGQVVESNSAMMAAFVEEFGVSAVCYPPVADERETIREAIQKAVDENDIVLISAGSSMGSKDFTSQAIEDLGDLKFHGVYMKPAKPCMLGIVSGKPVLGLPGFPLAVATGLRMFVRPLLENWGMKGPVQTKVSAVAGSTVETESDIDELRFGAVAIVEGRYVALPEVRSASAQINGIKANCYLHIPRGLGTVSAGDSITAVADATEQELLKTILIGGEYASGMEKIISNAARFGISVRFGEGKTAELIEEKLCHGVCISEKIVLTPAIQEIPLDNGSYLYVNTNIRDPLCSALIHFAEE